MNRFLHSVSIVLLSALAAAPAHAGPNHEELVNQVIEVTGTRSSLEQMEKTFESIRTQIGSKLSAKASDKLVSAIHHFFDLKELSALVRSSLEKLGDADLKEILDFYKTETGKKVTATVETMTKKSAHPDVLVKEINDFETKSKATPPNEERVSLLHQIVEQTHAIEEAVTLSKTTTLAIIKGMNEGQPPEARMTADQLDQTLSKMAIAIKGQVAQRVEGAIAYSYREFNNDDLKTTVKFMAGKTFQELQNIRFKQISQYIESRAEKFGSELGEAFKTSEKAGSSKTKTPAKTPAKSEKK